MHRKTTIKGTRLNTLAKGVAKKHVRRQCGQKRESAQLLESACILFLPSEEARGVAPIMSRLKKGSFFKTYDEAVKEIDAYFRSGNHQVRILSSKSAEKHNIQIKKEEMKIPSSVGSVYQVHWVCRRFGKPRQRSSGIRPRQKHYAMDCEFHLKLTFKRTIEDYGYAITSMSNNHNHEIGDQYRYKLYATNQNPDEETKEVIGTENPTMVTSYAHSKEHLMPVKDTCNTDSSIQDERDLRPVESIKAKELICCGGKCQDRIARVLLQNKQLRLENQKLRKEIAKLKENDPDPRLNKTKRRLVEGLYSGRQLQTRGVSYHSQLLNDTLELRRISKEAYSFVKKRFKLPIPSERTLRRYQAEMNKMVAGIMDDDSISSVNGRSAEDDDETGIMIVESRSLYSNSGGDEMPLEVIIQETDNELSVAEVEAVEVYFGSS